MPFDGGHRAFARTSFFFFVATVTSSSDFPVKPFHIATPLPHRSSPRTNDPEAL